MGNTTLNKAKREKNDEFYTQLEDIENELRHYKSQFKEKTVICNCDDPEYSNFWKYFNLNFEHLGLKRLLATHFEDSKQSYMLEMYKDDMGVHTNIKTLKQNGDFRSPECIELLKQADIVVTNPPFSLFREYIAQLMEYEKQFLIIGNQNALKYKEIFPLIKENKIWLGYGFKGLAGYFINKHYEDYATSSVHKEGMIRVAGVVWYTNLQVEKRKEDLILYKTYDPKEYPKYDNFDAINVNKTVDIPIDYDGIMGVPITFMDKHNPNQFEIVGVLNSGSSGKYDLAKPLLNGKQLYTRIAIRRIKSK